MLIVEGITDAVPREAGGEASGTVFDLQRFSLHDGPGIRTTVFLKGCPLRCIWCHNPESQAVHAELSVDYGRSDYPADLADVCPAKAIKVENGRITVDRSLCNVCGECVDSAPPGALRVIGRRMSVGDVFDVVLQDRHYYETSGGGITLSGGEPLSQFAFSRALLRRAKSEGLRTCVDTSGATLTVYLEDILDDVDLFLFDYKATDPKLHRRLTGIENRIVLENLDLLYRRGASILLRCPLVPGLNDTHDHLEAIADLGRTYPGLAGIEVMPYHDLGRDKAERIGQEPLMTAMPAATEEQKRAWIGRLADLGCERAYIEGLR